MVAVPGRYKERRPGMGMRELSGMMEIFYILIGVTRLHIFRNPSNCTVKLVHFTVCKPYPNKNGFLKTHIIPKCIE